MMILGLLAIMLVMLWVRAFYGSMQSYQQGEVFYNEHKYIRAVTYYDRAIHWYTPFNPYVAKSAERLWDIGENAEAKGDIKLALIAFRTIRRGFYAASHFITPGKAWIKKCDLKIEALVVAERKNIQESDDINSLKETLREDQKNKSPDIPWTIVLEIGFLGWVGTVIGFIMCRLRHQREPKILTSSILLWIMLFGVFFALWIVGMMKA